MKKNYKLSKWLNGEMTETELAEFKSSSDYDFYEKIKEYSSQLNTSVFDDDKMLSQIITTPKKEIKVKSIDYKWILKIAASLVFLLGFAYMYLTLSVTTQTALNAAKTSFQLPDKSEVVLNSGSEIEYKKWNWKNNRKLNLKGEAYFKVTKGERFEVLTPLGKVTVLGTQFNVKVRENRFDVSCYEGTVQVNYQDIIRIITKGQSVSFADGNAIEIPQASAITPGWTTGELTFEKENLNHIISELNRQYNVTIELKNIKSSSLFSGTIPASNLESAIKIICAVYHLQQSKIDNKIVLTAVNAKN
jgi:transmembrane sensor